MNTKTVLSLSHRKARKYFLENEKYVNFDLPPYFNFSEILNKSSALLGEEDVRKFFKNKKVNPKNFENVNYCVYGNKDGEFAWRPFEIIHPILYTALVHDITKEDNWKFLQERFDGFNKSGIVCESIPLAYGGSEGLKAKQIKRWWRNIEQRSLEMSLNFQYVFDVDISDCYGSLYTHSIAWALHGRPKMKNKKGDDKFLGNRIDSYIQMMRYGQTNGIPQGSTLMDFIAEIVLGYIDIELIEELTDKQKSLCSILRYRDDYKIFTNNPELGNVVVKKLSEVAAILGMKLNTQKTQLQTDAVLASVKEDKVYELFIPEKNISLSKELLGIYSTSVRYPNSGMVVRRLDQYYKRIRKRKRLGAYDDLWAILGLITNIAIKNPRAYSYTMAILSKLLDFCLEKKKRKEIISNLQARFKRVPNTGLLDVWLQRVSYKIDSSIQYDEKLTKLEDLQKDTGKILWESGWLHDKYQKAIGVSIIDKKELQKMPPVVTLKEVDVFKSQMY